MNEREDGKESRAGGSEREVKRRVLVKKSNRETKGKYQALDMNNYGK